MTRYWIAVASAEHARRGKAGFMQVNHGKEAPLRRVHPGDGVAYYSPTVTFGGKDKLQAFTLIGRVKPGDIYAGEMGGWTAHRRDVNWADADDALIAPLLEDLDFTKGNVKALSVEYAGDVVGLGVSPLTVALVKGFFDPIVEGINYVSAPVLAKERGIEVKETKLTRSEDFASTITLRAATDQGDQTLVGALFGKNDVRIVRIGDFLVEITPKGTLVLIEMPRSFSSAIQSLVA